jgi:autophagy-related protein 9
MAEHNERLLLEMEMNPALLQGNTRERWEAISDLDTFFTRVYSYFHERGLRCMLASRIISLLMLAFTIVFTGYLVEAINWDGLIHECVDEASCADVRLLRPDAFARPSPFLVLFLVLFSLYWLWMLAHFFWDLRALLEMRAFYRDKLHVDDSDLLVVSWDTVVQRVVELQRTARLCIVKDQLTAHDIANRILRKENFMVAFVNRGLLPLDPVPFLPSLCMLTKTLEWNLEVCILDAMFDKQGFRIRQAFADDLRGLQRRMVVAGVLNLLLSPFIAAFMIIFFFLRHAEEFHRRPAASAFSRDYSLRARWMMREFNELPHIFEARMLASTADATAYVQQFPAPLLTLFARFVTFLIGSVAAVLIVISLVNESVLVFYRLSPESVFGVSAQPRHGYNLLWWLAMASTILAISRAFSESPPARLHPEALMQSVASHTHYLPSSWRGKGHSRAVYLEFSRMYQYRILLLLQEICGCLTTPCLLCFALPQRAEQILAFIKSFTVQVEGVGHVCGFALFDFERHGDTRYGAPVDGMAELRSRDGKMEKAYVNFKVNHPSWRHDAGDGLLDNIAGRGSVVAVHRLAAAAAGGVSRDELAGPHGCSSFIAGAPTELGSAAPGGMQGASGLDGLSPNAAANSAALLRSSLGASGMMMLARSSLNDASLARASAHAGAGYPSGVVSLASTGALGAVLSELQAEQITADLIGMVEQHFVARDGCGSLASVAVEIPVGPPVPSTRRGAEPLLQEQGEDVTGDYVEYAPEDLAADGQLPLGEAPVTLPHGVVRPVTTLSTDV